MSKDTRPFALQRAQKRPGAEKLLAVQFGPQGLPIDADGLGFEFNAKPLQGFIELADGLLFVDSLIALQALDSGVRCVRNCICQLSLSTAGGALK